MKEIKCTNCGRCIGEADIKEGAVKIKCKKCKVYTTIEIKPAASKAQRS